MCFAYISVTTWYFAIPIRAMIFSHNSATFMFLASKDPPDGIGASGISGGHKGSLVTSVKDNHLISQEPVGIL